MADPEMAEEIILGTMGNISTIIGKAKSRKTFFTGIAVSAALTDVVIADNYKGMDVRFDIRFSQQQANHVWTVDTSGQNALIYASSAFLLLAQAIVQLPEQVTKRQRME